MNGEVIKALSKKLIVNLLILLVILVLVIAVTGIPMDFDITTFNGKSTPNMDMTQVMDSIKTNFKTFISGEALGIKVQGDTIGELLLKTAKKSFVILFWGSVLALLIGIPK